METTRLSLCTMQLCMYTHAEHIGRSKIRLYCISGTIMFSLFCLIIHGVIDIQGNCQKHLAPLPCNCFRRSMKNSVRWDLNNLKNMTIRSWDKKHAKYQIQIIILVLSSMIDVRRGTLEIWCRRRTLQDIYIFCFDTAWTKNL